MIQIDMSMPKNCLDCPACNEYLTCAIPVNGRKWGENDVREYGNGRPEWCPLKEQEADGEWIYGEDKTGVDGWHCSECGFFEPWFYEFTNDIDFIRFYGFCPSCGRKMTSYTGKPTQNRR